MLCSAVDMTCIPDRTRISSLSASKRELVNLMHDEGESESVLCERQSRDKRKRKSDESIINKEEDDPFKPYDCRFCPMRFNKSQALGGHMNRHRQEREKEQYQNAKDIISLHQQPRGFPSWNIQPPSPNNATALAMGRGTQLITSPRDGSHANFNIRLPTTSNTSSGSPSNVFLSGAGTASNNLQSQWQSVFAQVNAKSVQPAGLSAVDNTTMLQGRSGTREAINLSVLNARQSLGNYAGTSLSNFPPLMRGSGGEIFGCGTEASQGAGFSYGPDPRPLDTSGFQQTQTPSCYQMDDLRKQMYPASLLHMAGDFKATSGLPTMNDPKRSINNQMYMMSTPAVGTFQYPEYVLGSDQSSLPSSANLPQGDQFGNINPMQTFQQGYVQAYSESYNLPVGVEQNAGVIKEETPSGSALDVAHSDHEASGVDNISPGFSALSTYQSADFSSPES